VNEVRRSVAFAVVAALAVGALCLAIHGVGAALSVIAILAPLGTATVLTTHAVVGRRARLGSLRRQFVLIGAVAVAQLALAVLLFVELMFVSRHDAFFTVLVAAYTGLLGIWAGRLLGRRALADLDAVRDALKAVSEGRRDVRAGLTSRDELAQLGADVDAMIARLAGEERARRNLVAAVSHDLRTPLTALQLLAAAVDDDLVVDPATRRDYLARMRTHVRALSGLIDDLFELSRLESGDIRWTIENVSLEELVRETVDAMRPEADASSIAMRTELSERLALRANPEQIQRVLFNLLQNAIRHTPADGSITVRAERAAPDQIEIEVSDTGSGITPAERSHVFDAFFQGADRAARTDGSAGLGLAISRAIVEAHGGRIWLEEAPLGTTVCFSLPAALASTTATVARR
jgi:signal transduction histidine kinase